LIRAPISRRARLQPLRDFADRSTRFSDGAPDRFSRRSKARANGRRKTMNARHSGSLQVLAALAVLALSQGCASTHAPSRASMHASTPASFPASDPPAAVNVLTRASGTFDVKLMPRVADGEDPDSTPGATIGRMAVAKQFHGDLEGLSRGEMLALSTPVRGSAGYVAIERVEGKLNGRSGSFSLQHSGTLARGAALLAITVVPDSGTGDLVGLAGSMTIEIADGKQSYAFDYTLVPQR
jgi:hypothetical protein